MRKLDFANCSVPNNAMQQVGKLTSLGELNLTLNVISDDGLRHPDELTRLRLLGACFEADGKVTVLVDKFDGKR